MLGYVCSTLNPTGELGQQKAEPEGTRHGGRTPGHTQVQGKQGQDSIHQEGLYSHTDVYLFNICLSNFYAPEIED